MPLSSGTRLGRYEIRSQIGAGSMGEVYLAHDSRLRRPVALKLLPEAFTRDEGRLHRFEQEALAASSLNHPNIVTIHDVGVEGGVSYITTEFIDGASLRQRIAGGPLELKETLEIANQIVSALVAAHEAGIVHRDIKPENIMVRRDRVVKVLDFGLAKLAERKATMSGTEGLSKPFIHTDPGVVMGTVYYMSPEQACAQAVDGRADIWSLGVILYEMLTRWLPFTGESATEVLAAVLHNEPAPVAHYAPQVPEELGRIISTTLIKDRNGRYQTSKDMQADLQRLSKRLDIEAELKRMLTPEELQKRNGALLEEGIQQGSTILSTQPLVAPMKLASQISPLNNLSDDLLPLFGREKEIAAVKKLLGQEDVRLVTLTGVGGTGKTRLAQQVAHELLAKFTEGAFFIDLGPITDPELVASTIAQPLGVKDAGVISLKDSLKSFLRERQMLLILDNFEQVASAAPVVIELLSTAPHLKVLVTSRSLLHLSVEREFSVEPLKLPSSKSLPRAGELIQYAAVALFVERARLVKPSFTLTNENAHTISEICQRLDGLPLAIELAAARVKMLSPESILSRLENRLKLLTGGARDAPARQQTIRGTISWSYYLLNKEEQSLLNRLAVFTGGFTLEAAEAMCEVGGDVEVLDGVSSLVDKSLLVQKDQPDGNARFRMLEIVKEYSLEQLEASGEAETVRERHARFFLNLAETAEPELLGARQAEWLIRLEEEHDNLRSALRWSIEHAPETALRLAGAIWRLWDRHGHLTEGSRWLGAVLEKTTQTATPARVKALLGAGQMAWQLGDVEAACAFVEESLRAGRETGDKLLIARACNGLGAVAMMQGDLAAARSLFEECLVVSREAGDKRMTAVALSNLGNVAEEQGDYAAARPLCEEALALARQAGNKYMLTTNLHNLASIAFHERDFMHAQRHHVECLALARELGDKRMITLSLNGFAALAARGGAWEKSARLSGAAEAVRESIDYEPTPGSRNFRDQLLKEVCAALGEQAFSQAIAEGRTLTLEEAVALAAGINEEAVIENL
jgi:non-specific serine/threonine protein kinase